MRLFLGDAREAQGSVPKPMRHMLMKDEVISI